MNGMFASVNTTALMSDSAMTVLIGLVVVFGVLVLLTFVFWLFGTVARAGKSEEPKTVVIPVPKAAPAPVVEDGVSDEVVAVIAAAIAAMSDGTTTYAIRRIRPASRVSARPTWAAAGIADNTRPF